MLPGDVLRRNVLSCPVLSRNMLPGHVLPGSVLPRHVPSRYVLSRWPVPRLRARASTHALAEPHRAGPQHAAQLAGARQVSPVAREQREVLMVAGQAAAIRAAATGGEPVVGVRPRGGLLGVEPGRGDPCSQLRQLVSAALANGRERPRVPGQVERDLIRLPGPVPAGHSLHGQHGTIDAT
jgi:hypothetical protein